MQNQALIKTRVNAHIKLCIAHNGQARRRSREIHGDESCICGPRLRTLGRQVLSVVVCGVRGLDENDGSLTPKTVERKLDGVKGEQNAPNNLAYQMFWQINDILVSRPGRQAIAHAVCAPFGLRTGRPKFDFGPRRDGCQESSQESVFSQIGAS